MVYTKEVAKKIAGYGADKMAAQGYKVEAFRTNPLNFTVQKPVAEGEKPVVYFTMLAEGDDEARCGCFFFGDNGICKHLIYCDRLVTAQAEEDFAAAEAEAREAGIDEQLYAESEAAYRMMRPSGEYAN